jgi:hypothetical protein
MRSSRIATLIGLLALSLLPFSVGQTSPPASDELIASYHGAVEVAESSLNDDMTPGIKEEIPIKYLSRYQQWKQEFLSTEAGRQQWKFYETSPNFTLNIIVTRENAEGATTGKYKWNDKGELVAATITLGMRLDEGYPNPIYFPVMNSLVPNDSFARVGGSTLAATKIAHEFGHVNRTNKVDSNMYQLQTQLIPQYNKIFLSNGRNPNDPRLLELAGKIGGTPVQIWEDREYWGEANAMMYLRDRITEDSLRCALFNRIRHSVDLYAKDYEPRFVEIAKATPMRRTCGW